MSESVTQGTLTSHMDPHGHPMWITKSGQRLYASQISRQHLTNIIERFGGRLKPRDEWLLSEQARREKIEACKALVDRSHPSVGDVDPKHRKELKNLIEEGRTILSRYPHRLVEGIDSTRSATVEELHRERSKTTAPAALAEIDKDLAAAHMARAVLVHRAILPGAAVPYTLVDIIDALVHWVNTCTSEASTSRLPRRGEIPEGYLLQVTNTYTSERVTVPYTLLVDYLMGNAAAGDSPCTFYAYAKGGVLKEAELKELPTAPEATADPWTPPPEGLLAPSWSQVDPSGRPVWIDDQGKIWYAAQLGDVHLESILETINKQAALEGFVQARDQWLVAEHRLRKDLRSLGEDPHWMTKTDIALREDVRRREGAAHRYPHLIVDRRETRAPTLAELRARALESPNVLRLSTYANAVSAAELGEAVAAYRKLHPNTQVPLAFDEVFDGLLLTLEQRNLMGKIDLAHLVQQPFKAPELHLVAPIGVTTVISPMHLVEYCNKMHACEGVGTFYSYLKDAGLIHPQTVAASAGPLSGLHAGLFSTDLLGQYGYFWAMTRVLEKSGVTTPTRTWLEEILTAHSIPYEAGNVVKTAYEMALAQRPEVRAASTAVPAAEMFSASQEEQRNNLETSQTAHPSASATKVGGEILPPTKDSVELLHARLTEEDLSERSTYVAAMARELGVDHYSPNSVIDWLVKGLGADSTHMYWLGGLGADSARLYGDDVVDWAMEHAQGVLDAREKSKQLDAREKAKQLDELVQANRVRPPSRVALEAIHAGLDYAALKNTELYVAALTQELDVTPEQGLVWLSAAVGRHGKASLGLRTYALWLARCNYTGRTLKEYQPPNDATTEAGARLLTAPETEKQDTTKPEVTVDTIKRKEKAPTFTQESLEFVDDYEAHLVAWLTQQGHISNSEDPHPDEVAEALHAYLSREPRWYNMRKKPLECLLEASHAHECAAWILRTAHEDMAKRQNADNAESLSFAESFVDTLQAFSELTFDADFEQLTKKLIGDKMPVAQHGELELAVRSSRREPPPFEVLIARYIDRASRLGLLHSPYLTYLQEQITTGTLLESEEDRKRLDLGVDTQAVRLHLAQLDPEDIATTTMFSKEISRVTQRPLAVLLHMHRPAAKLLRIPYMWQYAHAHAWMTSVLFWSMPEDAATEAEKQIAFLKYLLYESEDCQKLRPELRRIAAALPSISPAREVGGALHQIRKAMAWPDHHHPYVIRILDFLEFATSKGIWGGGELGDLTQLSGSAQLKQAMRQKKIVKKVRATAIPSLDALTSEQSKVAVRVTVEEPLPERSMEILMKTDVSNMTKEELTAYIETQAHALAEAKAEAQALRTASEIALDSAKDAGKALAMGGALAGIGVANSLARDQLVKLLPVEWSQEEWVRDLLLIAPPALMLAIVDLGPAFGLPVPETGRAAVRSAALLGMTHAGAKNTEQAARKLMEVIAPMWLAYQMAGEASTAKTVIHEIKQDPLRDLTEAHEARKKTPVGGAS